MQYNIGEIESNINLHMAKQINTLYIYIYNNSSSITYIKNIILYLFIDSKIVPNLEGSRSNIHRNKLNRTIPIRIKAINAEKKVILLTYYYSFRSRTNNHPFNLPFKNSIISQI